MERWKARQTTLFENQEQVPELPELQWHKALVLLGSLLTEALAKQCETSERPREGGDDEDYR
jgi:hypothetical protein